jgi:lipopolysaccharide transport system permease protein
VRAQEGRRAVSETHEIVLRPGARSFGQDLAEAWHYREMGYLLTWRDVKVRYKQTALGAAWAILQPLLAMAVFTAIFGRFAGVPSEGVPYATFVYAGLLPWTYFSGAITNASQSLLANTNLVTKIYFPRILIPASACLAALLDLGIAATVLLVLLPLAGIRPAFTGLLVLPVLVVLLFLLALGCGLWLAALKVEYRDFQYVVPFLVQLWMFLTPVIYPASIVPERYRGLLALNPMVGVIEAFRAAVLGHRSVPWPLVGESAALAVAIFVGGLWYFRRMERTFADVI